MDPITALGAAGSVVGIASFGLQLSQTLYQFISASRGANTSVRAVLDGLNATTGAMHQIRDLLDEENKRTAREQKASLFSAKALKDIKDIVDQCLMIFWRIEAIITNKPESKVLDQEIARNLVIFNNEVEPKQSSKLLKLDSLVVLTKMQCLRWPYVSPRLKEFGQQLKGLQVTLILIFQIVSLASMRAKATTSKPKPADFKVIHELYTRIEQTANQAELVDINPQFGHHMSSMTSRPTKGQDRIRSRSRINNAIPRGSLPNAPPVPSTEKRQQVQDLLDDSDGYGNEDAFDAAIPSHATAEKMYDSRRDIAPEQVSPQQTTSTRRTQKGRGYEDRNTPINSRPFTGTRDSRVVFNVNDNMQGREQALSETLINLDSSEASSVEEVEVNYTQPITTGLPSEYTAAPWAFEPVQLKPANRSETLDSNKSNYRSPYITDLGKDMESPKDESQGANGPISEVKGDRDTIFELASSPFLQVETTGAAQPSSIQTRHGDSPSAARLDLPQSVSPSHSLNASYLASNKPQPSPIPTGGPVTGVSPLAAHNTERNASTDSKLFTSGIRDQTVSITGQKAGDSNKSNSSLHRAPSERSGSYQGTGLKSVFRKAKENDHTAMDQYDTAHLSAYVIKDGACHEIPYSGLLQIKHARTKGTSSWDQSWWKTFAFLCEEEMMAVENTVGIAEDNEHRALVYLERIKKSSMKFWSSSGSTLLAIVRTNQANSSDDLSPSGGLSIASSSDLPQVTVPVRTLSDARHLQSKSGASAYLSKFGLRVLSSDSQAKKTGPASNEANESGLASKLLEHPQSKLSSMLVSAGSVGPTLKSSLKNNTSNSTSALDASHPLSMDAKTCFEAFCTYAMYKISWKDAKYNAEEDGWEECTISRETLPDWDILERLEKLNKTGPSMTQKKLRLKPYQREQITQLIQAHSNAVSRTEVNFEWTLAQLDFSIASPSKRQQESPFLTAILRRAPKRNLDRVLLYEQIKNSGQHITTIGASTSPPALPQSLPPLQEHDLTSQTPPFKTVTISESKKKKKRHAETPDSDGDVSSGYTSVSERKPSRRSRKQHSSSKPETKSRRPHMSEKSIRRDSVDDSHASSVRRPNTARQSVSCEPSKQENMSERFNYLGHGAEYFYGGPRQSNTSGIIGEPAYSERYNRRPLPVRGSRPSATEREPIVIVENSRSRVGPQDDDSSASYDIRELPEIFRRNKSSDYPEYYDKKPYNARVRQNTGDSRNTSGTDIVQQLLLKWIANEGEEQEEPQPQRHDDERTARESQSQAKDNKKVSPMTVDASDGPFFDHEQNFNDGNGVDTDQKSIYSSTPSPPPVSRFSPPHSAASLDSWVIESFDGDAHGKPAMDDEYAPSPSPRRPSPIRLRPQPSSVAPQEEDDYPGYGQAFPAPQINYSQRVNGRIVAGRYAPPFGSSTQGASAQYNSYPGYGQFSPQQAPTAPLQPSTIASAGMPDYNALPGDYVYPQYNPFSPFPQPPMRQPESAVPSAVPQPQYHNGATASSYAYPAAPPAMFAPQPRTARPRSPQSSGW